MKNGSLTAGAVLGFLGVALGAFGAHGLADILTANGREATWETAVLYQFLHTGLLLVLGLLRIREDAKVLRTASLLAIVGVVIFSGSLYLLSLTNMGWLGAITPLGGLSFLVAWVLLFLYSIRKNTSA